MTTDTVSIAAVEETGAPGPAPMGAAPGPVGRGRLREWLPSSIWLAAAITLPAILIIGLLVVVVYLSSKVGGLPSGAFTADNYSALFSDSQVWEVMRNTVIYVAVTLATALFFGTTLAIVVERTDFGWEKTINSAMVLRILIPGFFTAMGWIFLFHPRIGAINQWLMDLTGLSSAPIDIVSLAGMGFVEGLGLSAVVFIMASASLRSMDGSLEEAARASGAGAWTTLRHVTLPLMVPSLLGASLFTATIAVSSLDVPLIMGLGDRIFVFSTYLYTATHPASGVPDYGVPAAFSTFMIVIALGFSWLYTRVLRSTRKYQVVTGRGYRPVTMRLGRWRWAAWVFVGGYFLWSTILPVLMVAWMSLQPFVRIPSAEALETASLRNFTTLDWDYVLRGVETTLKLMALAPTIAVVVSLAFSLVVVRSRLRFRFAYDMVAFLPQAVPQLIFAFSAFVAALYWSPDSVNLYGTLALLVTVMALLQLAFGTRMFNAGLLQIHTELEEAAAMSGASAWATFRRVTLPLLRPVVTYVWLWLALLSFRDLTIPTILGSQDTLTLSAVSWNLFSNGRVGASSAVTVLMVLAMLPAVLLFLYVTRKRPVGENPVRSAL
jgi:iron(III) transport system permease protein